MNYGDDPLRIRHSGSRPEDHTNVSSCATWAPSDVYHWGAHQVVFRPEAGLRAERGHMSGAEIDIPLVLSQRREQ